MDDVYNLSRTAEAIRLLNVDIVGLQEVDNNTDRHPHDNQVCCAHPPPRTRQLMVSLSRSVPGTSVGQSHWPYPSRLRQVQGL